jgi:two-component system chemotaxis response regulator CheB
MPSNKRTNSGRYKIGRYAINSERIKRDIIVIGASAGGVVTLMELFASFPPRMAAAVCVVLHRSPAKGELAHVLSRRSVLPMIEPENETVLNTGRIYLAPPDHHVVLTSRGIAIQRGPKEHSTRPAIDVLFRTAAMTHRPRVVGVLLTGAGEDGVSGLIAISKVSGVTLTQDPDEAYVPYMPLNALKMDDVDGVLRIKEMAPTLTALAAGEPVIVASKKPR